MGGDGLPVVPLWSSRGHTWSPGCGPRPGRSGRRGDPGNPGGAGGPGGRGDPLLLGSTNYSKLKFFQAPRAEPVG